MSETDFTIYDVLRALVNNINWRTETEERRMHEAIQRAQDDEVFRTEGRFKL